ncbi:hypothetical protein BT93_L5837 [Corymbia citriodora subsp. variegata]|uniref:Core domain-containing protein n=1 Tax=Corymbia citriodora subsp. variegata TaxID=360336 RepID=A0A8T0CIK4_CORYI|nr:hypothetical protein BT93_L5837 [Corymbia citriodora subsp. variegata]
MIVRCLVEGIAPLRGSLSYSLKDCSRTHYKACATSGLRYSNVARISRQQQTNSTRRQFSTSVTRYATAVRHNPRLGEDGKEMTITISERAARRLKKIVSSPPKKNSLTSSAKDTHDSHLRVTVTAGGCHGFQYLMNLESQDKINDADDTVFEYNPDESDPSGIDVKAQVVMDEPSLELLKGSTIDFTTELIGSQFKIVGNPRATSSCGCGTSFDIE